MYLTVTEQRQGALVFACPEEFVCNWTKPRRTLNRRVDALRISVIIIKRTGLSRCTLLHLNKGRVYSYSHVQKNWTVTGQNQGVHVLTCLEICITDRSTSVSVRQVLYFWISTHAWSLCDKFFISGSPPMCDRFFISGSPLIPFLDLHPCMSRDLHNRPRHVDLCVTGSLFLDLHPYHFWISTYAWSLCDRFFISGSPPMHI